MKYNFDERIERRGTDCLKYDFAARRGKPEDVLPLTVAGENAGRRIRDRAGNTRLYERKRKRFAHAACVLSLRGDNRGQ